MIANSNVKHELDRGEYAQRRTMRSGGQDLGVATLRNATLEAIGIGARSNLGT